MRNTDHATHFPPTGLPLSRWSALPGERFHGTGTSRRTSPHPT